MLASVVASAPILSESGSKTLVDDRVIIFSTERILTPEQLSRLRASIQSQLDSTGYKAVVAPAGITPTLVSSSPYFMREKINDYELEVHCQSHDELKEWMS